MRTEVPPCAIDSNVILRYILRDVPDHDEAAAAVIKGVDTAATTVLCDPVNFAEVVFVLESRYGLEREAIAAVLTRLLKAPGFVLPDKQLYARALALYATSVRHFGDACACALALTACDGRLYSFDRQLSAVEGLTRLEHPPKH